MVRTYKRKTNRQEWSEESMVLPLRKCKKEELLRLQPRPIKFRFFDLYEQEWQKYNFSPTHIFNVDETGIQTTHQPPKILAQKGKKQVGAIASAERGTNVTAVVGMSASGQFVPPMLVFPRVRMSPELSDGAPPGTLVVGQEKRRIVRLQQVAKPFGLAYRKTATIDNALSGFEKTGLCPCNRDIFPDWMFLPSEITDLPQEDVNDKECEARNVREKKNLTEKDDVRRQSIGLDGKVGANHPDEQIAGPSGNRPNFWHNKLKMKQKPNPPESSRDSEDDWQSSGPSSDDV
ncbi:hypothetical protein ANN_08835, partial [Periplaneta americana]